MATYKPKAVAVTVGTTAVQVQATVPNSLKLGLIIQADKTNTNDIFVGGLGVTIATGIQLDAGESISLNDFGTSKGVHEWDLTQVYLISDAAGQKVRVVYSEMAG